MRSRQPRMQGLRDGRTGPASRGGARTPGCLESWSRGPPSREGRGQGRTWSQLHRPLRARAAATYTRRARTPSPPLRPSPLPGTLRPSPGLQECSAFRWSRSGPQQPHPPGPPPFLSQSTHWANVAKGAERNDARGEGKIDPGVGLVTCSEREI